MDAGQKERDRHCDGVVDGCPELAKVDRPESSSTPVATILDVEPLTVLSFSEFVNTKGHR